MAFKEKVRTKEKSMFGKPKSKKEVHRRFSVSADSSGVMFLAPHKLQSYSIPDKEKRGYVNESVFERIARRFD